MSRNGEVLPVEVQHGTPVLPDEICLKLIDEIEQKKREAKGSIRIEVPEEDIELQSIWPQLSTVVKWLIKNNHDEALEVLHLIIQRRTEDLQKRDPDIDVTSAIKSTIMSLIKREESIFEDLMRGSPRDNKHSEEEVLTESVDTESLTVDENEEDQIDVAANFFARRQRHHVAIARYPQPRPESGPTGGEDHKFGFEQIHPVGIKGGGGGVESRSPAEYLLVHAVGQHQAKHAEQAKNVISSA
jgi:hypothetical protein